MHPSCIQMCALIYLKLIKRPVDLHLERVQYINCIFKDTFQWGPHQGHSTMALAQWSNFSTISVLPGLGVCGVGWWGCGLWIMWQIDPFHETNIISDQVMNELNIWLNLWWSAKIWAITVYCHGCIMVIFYTVVTQGDPIDCQDCTVCIMRPYSNNAH